MAARRPENALEIQVFAAMRSGHHAIIHWLLCHFPGVTLFRNNVCGPEHSIYRNATRDYICRDAERPQPKDCYAFNVEDHTIDEVVEVLARRENLAWGTSATVVRILILRDLYNFIASRLAAFDFIGYPCEDHSGLWASHAREFARLTQKLPGVLCIRYNDWVRDADYRRSIAVGLGLEPTDAGLQHVPRIGGGSSFDGTRFDGRAQEMAVFERWRAYADDPRFRAHTADPELRRLSRQLFGSEESLGVPPTRLPGRGQDHGARNVSD